MVEALDIFVKGIVQGVGFRPFVYKTARRYLISGWVLNAADGVRIHAEGESKLLGEFVMELSGGAPAAAQVSEIELHEAVLQDCEGFEIRFSDEAKVEQTTLVSPELATCDDCLHELFNPNDRRFRYPFINCTNCGPRFTIIDGLPYDRAATSMREFAMCGRCGVEYAEPLDRRFHAQPDACFDCGPHVTWCERGETGSFGEVSVGTTREESDAVFARAAELLCAGGIVAVKGLGGFHLVCDARNAEAVAELRRRKRREGKAFAVMMAAADDVRHVCEVSEVEEAVLSGVQRPIVLLRKRRDVQFAPGLADGLDELGVMLPYTPVQHLLMSDFRVGCADRRVPMLVMTSGNIHDEPIVIDDAEARVKFAGIADGILGNDRAILTRFDDSVVRVIRAGSAGEAVQFIRRARGYAPLPVKIPAVGGQTPAPTIFATGPEQKSTFAFLRGEEAFVSQHVGDMENAETYDAWLETKRRFEKLFELDAARVACDRHPEYLSSKWAHGQSLPVTEVQHHHAHIVSVLAEHGIGEAVCGIAFDGTGYGMDGAIWGGEVLLANTGAFERFANFAYVPMPGGAAAIMHPLRMAYGVLWAFDLLEHPGAVPALAQLGEAAGICDTMIERGINTPMTSSVGRLFDAASALLGVCTEPAYEGEAACLLGSVVADGLSTKETSGYSKDSVGTGPCPVRSTEEENAEGDALSACDGVPTGRTGQSPVPTGGSGSLAEPWVGGSMATGPFDADAEAAARYAVAVVKNSATEASTAEDTSVVLLDAQPTFRALLDDFAAGVPVPVIARRFHDALVGAIVLAAELVRAYCGINTVALSGGVFMNRYLVEHTLAALEQAGFTVAVNRELPPNDGCISVGQAVVAWARETEEKGA